MIRFFRVIPAIDTLLRSLVCLELPVNYGNSKGRPIIALLSRCALSTSAVSAASSTGRKRDFQAAYDRIVKKRERQEKAKDKYGKKVIEVWQGMSVKDLASTMNRPLDNIYEIMLYVDGADAYDTANAQITDMKIIENIVKRAGFRPTRIKSPASQVSEMLQEVSRQKDLELKPRGPPDPTVLVRRCPIVTVMGHVDHGKTTLLDALRNTSVVDQEFGGITQHIGAFSVKLPGIESAVTFLDTPGHAAFSAMRSRGAHVTDIVVLVVAAEDGVMEQTRESIRFANAAKVPIIVAINKCDKPEADIAAAKKGLWSENIALEEFGGDVQSVCISALKKTGLDTLVEAILTQAEMMQLKADPTGFVEAVVVESRTDPSRGRLCTAIIQRGTLKKGAFLVAGSTWARVRGMFDEKGLPLQVAVPGIPVEIIGWRELPSAGDLILQCEDDTKAERVVAYRKQLEMEEKMNEDEVSIRKTRDEHLKTYKADLEKRRTLGVRRIGRRTGIRPKEYIENKDPKVAIIVKSDVDGSLEAIMDVVGTYYSNLCRLDIVHYGVGNVLESDINLAEPFKGIIYAFNVQTSGDVQNLAKERKVEIRNFNIIYRLVEDLKAQLNAQLPMVDTEEVLGVASVLEGFTIKDGRKKLKVAGCRCMKGTMDRKARFKFMRGEEILYDGPLTSMRHFKQEVNTIIKDQECGLAFDNEELNFQLGDSIVCYATKKVKQFIKWDPPGF